jgi:hypothetical protein
LEEKSGEEREKEINLLQLGSLKEKGTGRTGENGGEVMSR